jgi:hypothetical protein
VPWSGKKVGAVTRARLFLSSVVFLSIVKLMRVSSIVVQIFTVFGHAELDDNGLAHFRGDKIDELCCDAGTRCGALWLG